MKYLLLIFAFVAGAVLLNSETVSAQLSILKPSQGGTGIGSASTIGDCLKVLTTSPFAFTLASCGSGGGGGGTDTLFNWNSSTNIISTDGASTTATTSLSTNGFTANNATTTNATSTNSFITRLLTVDAGTSTVADNARIWLKSWQEWVSPTHNGDLIRLQPMNDFWKVALSFLDKNGINRLSLVSHDYLSAYDPALDKTFTSTDLNTTTDTITLTSHGWSTGDAVWFGASSWKLADFPDGIYPVTRYFIRSVDANTVAVYRSSSDATADRNRLPMDNATAAVTFTITKNNQHHHTSIEVADKSGTLGADDSLHSRVAYTHDYYPMAQLMTDTELQLSGTDMTLFTDPTSNQNIYFGVGRDNAGRRFGFQRHGGTGEFRIATFGADGLNGGIAGLRMSSTTANIGILGAPSSNTAFSVTGSSTVSGSGFFGGALAVNSRINAEGSIFAGANDPAEALIIARSNGSASDVAGTLRVTGESNGYSTYRGGFFRYDPLNNFLLIGTHDTADSLTASDINSLRFDRATGNIEALRPFTMANATATTFFATSASSTSGFITRLLASNGTSTNWFSSVASSTSAFTQNFLAKDATTTTFYSNTFDGANLSDCDAADNALTWNISTKLFGCNTITATGGGGSDGNWVWNSTNHFLRPSTTTNDFVLGGSATATAQLHFATSTNRLRIGLGQDSTAAFVSASSSRFASTTLTASTTLANATTSTFAITSLLNCDTLDTDANGTVRCGTDASGGGGASFGQGWELNGSGQLAPTTTRVVAVNSLVATGTATSTFTGGLQALGANITSFFTLGADTIRDITGVGLSIVGDTLACTTATWSVFGCLSTADYAIFQNKISSTSLSWTDSSQIDGTYTSATGVFTASVVADSIGDTQLAFNTGQNLTTTSDVTFSEATTTASFAGVASSTQLFANSATTTTFFSQIASSTRGFFTNLLAKHATTTSLAVTNLNAVNCDVKADTSGNLTCGTDATGGGGGGVSDWVKETTFGALALTPTTTIPIWAKDNIYASSSLYIKANQLSQHNLGFIDVQRTGADFTLMRIRAPRGDSNEATLSLVNDLSTTDAGVDEEFVDFYNERYEDALQWGLRQAHSGTGIAKPFALGHWNTALGKDIGNKLIVMPSGAVAVARATSTIPVVPFYVASSTATTLARFDTTPGTPRFSIGSTGDISLSGASGNLTINPNLDGGQYNIGVDTSGTLALFGSGAQFLNLNMLDGTFTNASGTTLNHATATRLFATFASTTNFRTGGATSTQLAVTNLISCDTIDTDANGSFRCGTDAGGGGGAPGGSDGTIQYNNGGSFGGMLNTFWDDVNNSIGFGSTTPWAKFSITETAIDRPLFVISTSSASTSQMFSVSATTSILSYTGSVRGVDQDSGVRVGIGIADYKGFGGLLDQFVVRGRFNTDGWLQFFCDAPSFQATISADTASLCGSFVYNEGTASTLTLSNSGGVPYSGMTLSAPNDGANFIFPNIVALATSTPVMEVNARIGITTGTSTHYYIGFATTTPAAAATLFDDIPSTGCYFIAYNGEHTAPITAAGGNSANWNAVCANAGTYTVVNTGLASSTNPGNNTGRFRTFRIEMDATQALFYVRDGQSNNLVRVARITTNLPALTNSVALYPQLALGRTRGSTILGFHFNRLRIWIRDVLPESL